MRRLSLIILLILLLFSIISGQEKTINKNLDYNGGPDSLISDISYSLSNSLLSISKTYILFYEVSVNKKSGIKRIELINSSSDNITRQVSLAIQKTSENWRIKSKKTQVVIIPIFLIKDSESTKNYEYFFLNSRDYIKKNNFLKCYFITPIVFNFFSHN